MPFYNPDPGAIASGINFTRILSQRDLGLNIPLPFVTEAALSLTPACFADQRYEEFATSKCVSNLLAVGFNRFEVDLYWDVSRQVWSLCPVQLGEDGDAPYASTSVVVSSSGSSSTSLIAGSTSMTGSVAEAKRTAPVYSNLLWPREPSTTSSETSLSAISLPSMSQNSTISSPDPTNAPDTPVESESSVVQVGPYACSKSAQLGLLTKIFSEHLHNTSTDLNATMKYMILNLHVATEASDPTGSPQSLLSPDLPSNNDTVSAVLSSNLSSYLYTPSDLASQRLEIDRNWLVENRQIPVDTSYFTVGKNGKYTSTPNGWPCESYVEMQMTKRLFAGYGEIDPQMAQYNVTADAPVIFPADYIQTNPSVGVNGSGSVTTGCFYIDNAYGIGSINSSWAVTTVDAEEPVANSQFAASEVQAGHITYCGITALLNHTLGGVTADQDYQPYGEYVQSTIWSWGPGQPGRQTNDGPVGRCATLNATSGYWQARDCTESHHSACHNSSEPNEWAISEQRAIYQKAGLTCRAGTVFNTPRTALQNTYLLNLWRNSLANQRSNDDDDDGDNDDDDLLWVDFNDLDVATCWTLGQNSTCPYLPESHETEAIAVPVVAAIIVFVLAALTVFVKFTANRRQSKKKRRRGDNGWDYEGVPS